MKWGKSGSFQTASGSKFRIKTHTGGVGPNALETTQLTQAVTVSQTILLRILAQLAWPEKGSKDARNARLERLFLTDARGPAGDALDTIYKKLELVVNGIKAKVNVKVAPDVNHYGYIGFMPGHLGVVRGVVSRRHNLAKVDGKLSSFCDVHIDQSTLPDTVLSVITLIHEATHKYASTNDHFYLKNDGITYDGAITRAQALNNADTFAWFCYAEYDNL